VNVTHVIIGLNVGGAELMLKRMIESHLDRPDIEHSVISLTDMGVLGEQLTKQGVAVYCLGMSSILKGPVTFFKLRKLLRTLRPDVVHTWMYHADLLGGLAARSVGLRQIVWCIRSTDISKGGSKVTLVIRKLCAYLSYGIPKEIVCAANVSRDVHVEVGYDPSKMQVIPNGFDLAKFSNNEPAGKGLRQSLEIPEDSLVFISVGRYSPVKDHKTFVLAACELLKHNNNAHFLMVGRDLSESNSALMKLILSSGAESRFHLLGQRSDISVCLASADVFCLHSVTEGFPNVLGEAMLTGLPCITTDVGDARLLLATDEMTVKASDPKLLAQKMAAMSDLTENERKEVGLRNRNRIIDEFSLSSVSNQYMKLYIELSAL